jgi:hypothetical protein
MQEPNKAGGKEEESAIFQTPLDRTRNLSHTHKLKTTRRVPQVRSLNLGLAVAFFFSNF